MTRSRQHLPICVVSAPRALSFTLSMTSGLRARTWASWDCFQEIPSGRVFARLGTCLPVVEGMSYLGSMAASTSPNLRSASRSTSATSWVSARAASLAAPASPTFSMARILALWALSCSLPIRIKRWRSSAVTGVGPYY